MRNSASDLVRLFEEMTSAFSSEKLGDTISGAASRDFSNYVCESNLSVEQATQPLPAPIVLVVPIPSPSPFPAPENGKKSFVLRDVTTGQEYRFNEVVNEKKAAKQATKPRRYQKGGMNKARYP